MLHVHSHTSSPTHSFRFILGDSIIDTTFSRSLGFVPSAACRINLLQVSDLQLSEKPTFQQVDLKLL